MTALLAACGPAPAPRHVGTYAPTPWAARDLRPGVTTRGLVSRFGEVVVLEGDADLVSGADGQWGLRLDEDRNDVAAVCRRFAEQVADPAATLVLFTTFEDRGGGGPAYFVPIFDDTPGTGLGPLDQRDVFGVRGLEGFVNMKRLDDHEEEAQLPLLVHEVAHRHLAYLEVAPVDGATVAVPLLGRQQAHWHAALHTGGSVLGGHGFVESTPGTFVVARKNDALSGLDLYGLGLLEPDEVEAFFFVDGLRTLDGAPIPAEAQLELGTALRGERIALDAQDVVAALGRRPRADRPMQVVFALLTAPGQAASSTTVRAEAARIDALRGALEQAWPDWTRGRGALCTRLSGCEGSSPIDAGSIDAGAPAPAHGGCRSGLAGARGAPWLALLGLLAARRRRPA